LDIHGPHTFGLFILISAVCFCYARVFKVLYEPHAKVLFDFVLRVSFWYKDVFKTLTRKNFCKSIALLTTYCLDFTEMNRNI